MIGDVIFGNSIKPRAGADFFVITIKMLQGLHKDFGHQVLGQFLGPVYAKKNKTVDFVYVVLVKFFKLPFSDQEESISNFPPLRKGEGGGRGLAKRAKNKTPGVF